MMKNIAARIGSGILAVCLLFSLAACGESDASDSATPATSAQRDATTAATANWETFRFGQEAPGPEGCYIYQPRPENGINILYADYASGQLVYLCNRPECAHDDESCTSFRTGSGAGALRYYQDRLYSLGGGDWPDYTSYFSVCDKNGENAKSLLTLESGSRMSDLFAADGEAFYTLQTAYSDANDPYGRARLVRIALADGAKTDVSETDYADAEVLSGIGNEVVLYTYTFPEDGGNISDQTIIGVDKATGAEREIYSVPSGYIVGAKDGFAYVLRMEDGALDAVDLATGEVQTIPFDKNAITLYNFVPDVTGMEPEDAEHALANLPTMYNAGGIYDGKLFLVCQEDFVDNNYQSALYGIDLATGEVTRTTLSIGYEARRGSPILIFGEVGNDFLVLHDYVNNPFPSINKDGTPYEAPLITNQYALISKADFYASEPNYRDFALS